MRVQTVNKQVYQHACFHIIETLQSKEKKTLIYSKYMNLK